MPFVNTGGTSPHSISIRRLFALSTPRISLPTGVAGEVGLVFVLQTILTDGHDGPLCKMTLKCHFECILVKRWDTLA